MAPYLRRAVIAAVAAAIGAVCSAGAYAQAAKEPAAKAKRQDPVAKTKKQEPAGKANEQAPGTNKQDPAANAKKQDPVEAQGAIEAASKLLRAGKADQAAQSLSAALAGGNLPPAVMAKALYMRGLAYRQLKKPAQAVSDLTSALWLRGGLGGEERTEAQKQRIEAYADAGLTETGQVLAAAKGAPAAKTSSSNWLSNLFGSPDSVAAAPESSAKVTTTGTARIETATTVPEAPINGWASKTEVQSERVAATEPAQAKRPAPAAPAAQEKDPPSVNSERVASTAPAKAKRPAPATPAAKEKDPPSVKAERLSSTAPAQAKRPAPAAPAAKEKDAPSAQAAGGFRVQLTPVRTKAEALALAAKAKRQHAAVLGEPQIEQTVVGNMGSFYRVRFGPFANAQQSQAVCAKLKGSGFDCVPIAR
jgi:SPOR domain